VFNAKLLAMDLVEINPYEGDRYIVSEKGKEFGKNLIQGYTYSPRWFDGEFVRLLDTVHAFEGEEY
jgi:hypothetical protein